MLWTGMWCGPPDGKRQTAEQTGAAVQTVKSIQNSRAGILTQI